MLPAASERASAQVQSLPAPYHGVLVTDISHIRNFCIVAHIDHGKSTLADRLLELTHTVEGRDMRAQYLDKMDLERERGITIKAQAVRLLHEGFELNLIDTPGHVDFTYEVSRSLEACEGAVLLVDAAQGIEAQTLANFHLARDAGLIIVPALNKIDLPAAEPDQRAKELADLLDRDPDDILRISAKSGAGVKELLAAIVAQVPAPEGDAGAPLRALIFDSMFDPYRGVITYIRVKDGSLPSRERIRLMATRVESEAEEAGVMAPEATPVDVLGPGEVGYLVTGLREVHQAKVGDTITLAGKRGATEPLPGYREPKPMVWSGLFPAEGGDYAELREALDRLKLSDAALQYEPETSMALGFGFRCGFLGLLHMDIVKERLEREFDLELIATAPNVEFRVIRGDDVLVVHNPAEMPVPGTYDMVEEPIVFATIITPADFVGTVLDICESRRGEQVDMSFLTPERAEIHYVLPLAEIVFDFFDALKSRTRGYASLDYEPWGYQEADLVRVDVLLHGEPVDAFSSVVHREKAAQYGRAMVERLRELIPRQLFDVAIQASIGSRIVARETVKAKRKDVLAKCYGGDITRKRKLLEQQKKGKARMRRVGRVDVPQEAFIAALRVDQRPSGAKTS
jgi:GTP-binding protein LepA